MNRITWIQVVAWSVFLSVIVSIVVSLIATMQGCSLPDQQVSKIIARRIADYPAVFSIQYKGREYLIFPESGAQLVPVQVAEAEGVTK